MFSRMFLRGIVVIVFVCTAGLTAQDARTLSDEFYTVIRANNLTRLQAMLASGADPNVKETRGGATPLMYAASVGSVEAMKLLLDGGADPNIRSSADSTALMWSATDIKKVRLLVDRGADVNAVSSRGRTALFLAAMSAPSAEIVRLLIARGADVKGVDALKMTALHAATWGNDTETIRLLIDAGLDVNAAHVAGFTPLINAASTRNVTAAKLLLAKGANVNAVAGEPALKVKAGTIALGSFTPLHMIAPSGSAEFVKALLDAGAKVNVQEARGLTPLMLAVATDRQNLDVIRMLIAKGADVNAKDPGGETALDWARKFKAQPAIELLRRAGAVETAAKPVTVPPFAPADLHTSVERGIRLLERTTIGATAGGGCASCHHHNVTDFVAAVARDRGIRIDEKAAADRQQLTKAPYFLPLNLLERMDSAGSPIVPLYALAALAASGYEPDRTTDALVANIVAHQESDGYWRVPLGVISRPPIEGGGISATALAINVMKTYGSPGRAADLAERTGRAAKWLTAATAITAEDRNMQLIGLECIGADRSVLQRLAKAILKTQRADGGWAQKSELTSDAYATGQTLFALAKTGTLSTNNPAFQKGMTFLLSTQHADGSWYVRSRAVKFQPYFESGFPYEHDQWISAMGTGWATAALAMALPSPQSQAVSR
jgi:ankyrin repeat protein